MRRDHLAFLTAVLGSCLVGGCGFIDRHFHKQNTEYKASVEEKPLEVPPDLDRPNTTGALQIPNPGAAPVAGTPASVGSSTPAGAGETPSTGIAAAPPSMAAPAAPSAGGATLSGAGLQLADTVESAWHRVGLAIERSGAATVVSRDESAHTYDVQTTGTTTQKAGWFKRMVTFGRAKTKKTAAVRLTVRVATSGGGSLVSIEGATDEASQDAARALLETLKQRLS